MPTRISGWIVALGLAAATILLADDGASVPWRDILMLALPWIVLGEAAYWAMRLVAPAPPPPAWFWTNGVVLSGALAALLLLCLEELRRDPGVGIVALSALVVALLWFLCDLLALAFWRVSRSVSPPVVTAGRIVVWTMVDFGLSLVVLVLGFGKGVEVLETFGYVLVGAPLLVALVSVFFDYPAALDRRKRNKDAEFRERVANAPPPPVARVMPGKGN